MGQADSPANAAGQSKDAAKDLPQSIELLIIGGGIMGLWAAVKAERLGIKTLLLDAVRPAAGASGGLLGALMAHMPDQWNDKKRFQLEALIALETEVAELEAQTGLACGYRRSGRLIPLPKPHLRPLAERRAPAAAENWVFAGRRFSWTVRDLPSDPLWLSPDACGAGVVEDTLAARISPRSLTTALVAAIDAGRHVQRADGLSVRRLLPRQAELSDGRRMSFGHAIVAAGTGSFDLLAQLGPPLARPLGAAVKGQAALLEADVDPALPVVFLNGLYIVPHEDGRIAIGSTSEDTFDSPEATDHQLDALLRRAMEVSPKLQGARVVERWAGVRPKAIDREPMVGPHPDAPQVFALTGGFKVSFGLAHKLADAALGLLGGRDLLLPDGFQMSHHLQVAQASG
ncbi:NAD(P)/FAD-dependent oxidoreductase [Rhizobium sp. SL86]|uniref:NAD(P)/FAD-dependent oxidoreductase n=1 Tax=Rhizobium sp. SL86 TaxID=2995148 RepID=UPI0022753F28|nr:FAD-binding oxidoreductase [Rhizobium sp. SL86]MCY1668084.1 FAD-binding oxidoreductase [Rhizobium sp. SL86]